MVTLIDFKPPEIDNLIAIATFGSYGTEFWVTNRSDIDILILLEHRIDARNEFKIDPLKEIDFRLCVNKYIRENKWLQNKIDEDNEFLRRANNVTLL